MNVRRGPITSLSCHAALAFHKVPTLGVPIEFVFADLSINMRLGLNDRHVQLEPQIRIAIDEASCLEWHA